ncbi:Autoinducer 2 kinase LsrK [compost metagenome]
MEVNEIRSLSGGAKSRAWCEIKANASALPVRTMRTTDVAASLGAAILAGVAAGVWNSVEETATRFAEYDLEYTPNPEHQALYEGMLKEYKLLMRELNPSFKRAV